MNIKTTHIINFHIHISLVVLSSGIQSIFVRRYIHYVYTDFKLYNTYKVGVFVDFKLVYVCERTKMLFYPTEFFLKTMVGKYLLLRFLGRYSR